jgi:hypothetical protein
VYFQCLYHFCIHLSLLLYVHLVDSKVPKLCS